MSDIKIILIFLILLIVCFLVSFMFDFLIKIYLRLIDFIISLLKVFIRKDK